MNKRLIAKKVIVTGASSGIGERLVWHIAKNGGIPIMLARSIDKLEGIQHQLSEAFGIQAFSYQVDLLDEEKREAVFKQILIDHPQVCGLINNAGSGLFEYVESMNWEEAKKMFELNVFALVQGTQQVLNHFLTNREGHIVNIASQAGKMATPKSSVYASTKHAVLGFTNALRMEVASKHIAVTAVNLGPVRTNFFVDADPTGSYQVKIAAYMLDPDRVAKKIVNHLFKKKREINMPGWMEFGSKLYTLFPKTMELILKSQFNKK
ncbi:SDR family NAD(P)-dependent oxidoreductase [Virgibacillus necropolis]|uniref:Oxidoreductase n=1 Tax=Virgibacillus necropolis TaxID=163877 RepID=A0A221MCH7_9BACI|nr:SDR family oxidoreductase [Virgibacillus necropolis]ASN05355.1 oxidoreductase [Virgibacillus necropolis]